MRNAKIVCTLGPASDDRETIAALVEAGMSVARLNASHGTTEDRAAIVDRIRRVDESTETPVATMVDVAGPEVRTAPADDPVTFAAGDRIRFVEGDVLSADTVGLSRSIAAVSPDDRVLLDDGRIETVVESVGDEGDGADGGSGTDPGDDGEGREDIGDGESDAVVRARVESGGSLGGRKGVNVPGVDLGFDPVTEADRAELELAARESVDFVAASHVRSAEDVYAVASVLDEYGADIPVVAKIERDVAVSNLEEIVEAAYGVMVARGDLGVECPLERVPLIQKRIIRRCHETGTPVITATEMLDSMIHESRPTRAETSDVANAVLDGTDAVMLSGETAVGDHPVRVVETMRRIVGDIEASTEYDDLQERRVPEAGDTRTAALTRSARYLARDVGATAVVVASESGYTARSVAKYRPPVPVVAATPDDRVRRQLSLTWGVTARHAPMADSQAGVDAVILAAVDTAIDAGVVESGDTVVVVSGMMTDLDRVDTTNTLKVHVAAESVATGRGVVGGTVSGPLHPVSEGDLADVPPGAVLAVPARFDAEFRGEFDRIGAILHGADSLTGYPAVVGRELGVPTVCGVAPDLPEGAVVTVDGDRGVVYRGEVTGR